MNLIFYLGYFLAPVLLISLVWLLMRVFHEFRKQPLRFHLSTAVVLLFLAGGLLWLNMQERAHPSGAFVMRDTSTSNNDVRVLRSLYGWPFPVCERRKPTSEDTARMEAAGTESYFFEPFGIIIDMGIALVILFAVGSIYESWIWRAGAKREK